MSFLPLGGGESDFGVLAEHSERQVPEIAREGEAVNTDVTQRNRQHARAMRAEPTPAENRLWQIVRGRKPGGLKFKRQEPMGPYIVDFVCHEKRLIIEVDGVQHSGSGQDRARDQCFEEAGYHVLRFWNDEVLQNSDGVAGHILAVANAR